MINGRKIAAICLSEMQNEDTAETLFELYRTLEDEGWKTIIFNAGTSLAGDSVFDKGEVAVFDLIPYERVDGIIMFWRTIKDHSIIGEICDKAKEHGKPVLMLDCDENRPDAYTVIYDESKALRNLVTHLVEHHCFTKINLIAGERNNYVSDRRVAIFREVLDSHNIPFREDQIGYGDFYDIPAVAVVSQFMNSPYGLPEAIVCLNDSMAIAVTEHLISHGIDVPRDVTVTGLDGIMQERCNYPRITTCRRDVPEMATFIVKTLIAAVQGRAKPGVYPFELYFDPSESCGCAQADPLSRIRAVGTLNQSVSIARATERDMVNMMTQLSTEETPEGLQKTLHRFVDMNSYFCINQDHDRSEGGEPHRHHEKPFTEVMNSYRYFHGETMIEKRMITPENLIPEWGIFERRSYPMVVSVLHAQEQICGYFVAYPDCRDLPKLNKMLQKIQHMSLNIDNVLGLYIQKRSLRNTNSRLRVIQRGIIAGFSELVESRDDSTGMHIKRTSTYMRLLVDFMAEKPKYRDVLTEKSRDLIVKAAPLHDIGKIKISDTILNKPGRLTPEEFERMKVHTLWGGKIIDSTLTEIEDEEYLEYAKNVATYHHEKWSGGGYPEGLSGEDIPLCARLMAVVDVFDALSSKRVYKDAFSLEDTFRIIEESSGTHFDPDVAECFLTLRPEIEKAFYDLHVLEMRLQQENQA